MPQTDSKARWRARLTAAWKQRRFRGRLTVKLLGLLLCLILGSFALVGYLNVRQHRHHLEDAAQASAARVSDVIKRSTSYYMLRNDREGLYHIIDTIGGEPGMVRIRIFNQQGRISFSTDSAEINQYVEKDAEACYACHAQGQPLVHLDRPDRFRIYRTSGKRVVGVINPIENRPECSNAPCHAHPAEQKILGVLDTNLSLAQADAGLAESTEQMLANTLLAAFVISLLTGFLIWRLVGEPLKALKTGTEKLAEGDLGYQIQLQSRDEMGELAASFNEMSREVAEARQGLERRVEQKTRELKRAHEQMLQSEKLASIGKLAAVVAHEINNPLSGILTYARLVRRWMERGAPNGTQRQEMQQSLQLMESEVRRCGEIVRNMLTFARATPMHLEWTDLNLVAERTLALTRHKMELANVQLHHQPVPELPRVHCDPAQIEQLLLALVINGIEAMPHGGNLWVELRAPREAEVEIEVRDDGIGIPPDLLPTLFEPFHSTKEKHGVGLGLAISRQILDRHQGRIEVDSTPGRGTSFRVVLPVGAHSDQPVAAKAR